MKYINMTKLAHQLLKTHLNENIIAVDMTLGNGNDTLFLCQNSKFVYAFDIQQQAIDNSLLLLQSNNVVNYKLILDSHVNIINYIDKVDVAIFNLGYLPRSNKEIKTNKKTTILALKELMKISTKTILIVVYPGHKEGLEESNELRKFTKNKLSKYNFHIYENNNISTAPYIIMFTLKA